ncbi:hypothetical protein AvCA_25260 [Azotobacter vinelandii CA]|uniref:Uncharacterized protein n=2 Tax=Azotobacter vinelandii TaxID=354 RepID=C1DIM9_AZOVD|nr:hypothetical protein Avin_25260 [Azotobacter vinelandii DJ]AGK14936.1 hypothetical protein AvCA_25260 [Azotobacter vinelandii CA]AGK20676.1 hypothetical protein AvCA6_25260 [Azotobacter vinelandii CA6]
MFLSFRLIVLIAYLPSRSGRAGTSFADLYSNLDLICKYY